MSKRCPECHKINEDSRSFCTYCGATLDPHLRLIQELENQKKSEPKKQPSAQKEEISFNAARSAPEEKKKSAVPWIILGVIAVAAVVLWFFLA